MSAANDDDVRVICLADITPRPVRWLWRGRVPRGALTLVEGDPDVGKSTLTLDLAARLTTGACMPLDDEPTVPGNVLLIASPEDDPTTDVRPRLDAAGADTSRVFIVAVEGAAVTLPERAAAIRRVAVEKRIDLVIVDPLTAFVGAGIQLRDDTDARRMLQPLATMARETGCAVVVVRHFNKEVFSSEINRGAGSIGIVGLARSALAVRRTEKRANERKVTSTKCNLGAPPAPAHYVIDSAPNGAGMIRWLDGRDGDAAERPAEQRAESPTDRVVAAAMELDGGGRIMRDDIIGHAKISRAIGLRAIADAVKAGRLVDNGRAGIAVASEVKAAA